MPPVVITIAVLGALTGVLASLLALANRTVRAHPRDRLIAAPAAIAQATARW